jgi:dolichol-phosphate mannosyltransferase
MPVSSSIEASAVSVPGPVTWPAPEFSIILPTFRERQNLVPLLAKIATAIPDVAWEVIIVDDDSPDGTAEAAKELGAYDGRIRCLRRIGRRGRSGACIEGILASQAPFVAVMDADLQHDETLLAGMFAALNRDQADLVIATRYAEGGDAASHKPFRLWLSQLATRLTRGILDVHVSDPMSGFFAIKRPLFDRLAHKLSSQGFELLLDLLATTRDAPRIKELPYRFRTRLHGESKLDARVGMDFLGLLVAKATRDLVPLRFLSFALVGMIGTLVHLGVLLLTHETLGVPFTAAQTIAAFAAMTSNFALNNELTYAERRLRGFAALRGLALFYVVCSLGMLSNVGVATWIFVVDAKWWMAGLIGSLVGLVWNYAVSTTLVWRVQ